MQDFNPTLAANVLAALTTHLWFKTWDPVPFRLALAALVCIPPIVTYGLKLAIPSSTASLPLAYASFLPALAISVCAYRLSPLHPLAKYPGPIIPKITKLWGAWGAYRGKTHINIKELHDRYGPVVRIGPNELSTVDKGFILQIFGAQGMPKGPMWDGRRTLADGRDALIALRDSTLHAEMRGPWNKSFGAEPMKNYEEQLIRRIIEFNSRLKEVCAKGTAQVDIAKWIGCFTYDFMGDLAFSGDFRLMENRDADGNLEMMDKSMSVVSIAQHIPWFAGFFRSLPFVKRRVQRFVNHGVKHSLKRSKMELKRKDIFYYMGEESGTSGSDFEMIAQNCILAMVAGSDTTASAMSNAIYLLLSHPEKYQKLRQEVDTAFAEHGIDIHTQPLATNEAVGKLYGDVLSGLKYLNGVINETLRLFPSVPTSLQRAPAKGTSKVLQSGGTVIVLPEGNAITVAPYALHRDPRYFWPNPDSFIPERWLASADSEYITARDAFIPFSVGPQNCAGRSLALVELRYALAVLVKNFDMEFDVENYNPALWLRDLEDHFTFQKGPLGIRISLRNAD